MLSRRWHVEYERGEDGRPHTAHVYPEGGRKHRLGRDCWCRPQKKRFTWVHRVAMELVKNG